jgi:hypothetical protein
MLETPLIHRVCLDSCAIDVMKMAPVEVRSLCQAVLAVEHFAVLAQLVHSS